jgi:hypothetical protein
VGQNTIAVKFENFFDQEIKDKVKALPDSKYEPVSKEWFLRKDLMDQLFQKIGEICIDRGIKVVDIPDFVYELAKNTIPFAGKPLTSAKDIKAIVTLGKDFHYEQEKKSANFSVEKDLPEKIKNSIYNIPS